MKSALRFAEFGVSANRRRIDGTTTDDQRGQMPLTIFSSLANRNSN
jgi:hypothetical protein